MHDRSHLRNRSHLRKHSRHHVTNHNWERIRIESTQPEHSSRTFRHRAMCPGKAIRIQGRHGESLQPFTIVFIHFPHRFHQLLLRCKVSRINTSSHAKITFKCGIPPINGNTARRFGVEIFFSRIPTRRVVFICQAELIVFQKL